MNPVLPFSPPQSVLDLHSSFKVLPLSLCIFYYFYHDQYEVRPKEEKKNNSWLISHNWKVNYQHKTREHHRKDFEYQGNHQSRVFSFIIVIFISSRTFHLKIKVTISNKDYYIFLNIPKINYNCQIPQPLDPMSL